MHCLPVPLRIGQINDDHVELQIYPYLADQDWRSCGWFHSVRSRNVNAALCSPLECSDNSLTQILTNG